MTSPERADQFSLFEHLEAAYTESDEQGRAVESQLIEQARQGDHQAFEALYRRYVSAIYRYCWLHSRGSQEEGEDLTSTVFLKAWQAIAHYQDRGRPFLAWLHTIARNVVIDHLRRQGRNVPIEATTAPTSGIDENVEQRLEYDRLRQALNKLTDDQRQVVVYRFWLGYSGEEVAAIMGKRAGAVRALQLRALQTLKKLLGIESQTEYEETTAGQAQDGHTASEAESVRPETGH